MIFWGYIASLGYGCLCILLSALIFKLGAPKRITRKIVHILVGFEWVILYHFFGVGIHFLIVCLAFTLLLALEYKIKLLPMMSSDSENAPGTVFYGISMSVMAGICMFLPKFVFPFGIAVFCTSFGDGFAGLAGSAIKHANPKIYKEKTLFGALSNLCLSFVSVLVISNIFKLGISVGFCIMIALLAVGLELIGERGFDNVLLPLGVSLFSFFVISNPVPTLNYIIPIILTPFVVVFALGKGVLTKTGVAAAIVLDFVVSLALGNFGFVLLLTFLLLSTVVDKIKERFLRCEDKVSEKGSKRDELQVLANGIVAMFMAIFYLVGGERVFVVAFCTSLAEAFSDTCASGFGALSDKVYDIFKLKRVPRGISGGMTVYGTLASLVGAFLFSLIPLMYGAIDLAGYIIASVAAFLGAFFDTFLGSVVQAKYKCHTCGELTEKRIHCDRKTELVSGIRFVTNDAVNLFSGLFSAVIAIVFYIIIT